MAETYERQFPNQLDDYAELLAYRYSNAGDDPNAAKFYDRSGIQ